MKNIKTALGAIAFLVSGTAMAAGFSTPVNVTQVEVDSSGATNGTSTYLTFSAIPNNRPTCTGQGDQMVLAGSAENVKALTSLATAAWLSGKVVRVYFDPVTACDGPYARIVNIRGG